MGADAHGDKLLVRGWRKLAVGQILLQNRDHVFPHDQRRVSVDHKVDFLRLVEAAPGHRRVVGGIAGEPAVAVIRGRAGLARHLRIGHLRRRTGAVKDGVAQHIGHIPGRMLTHGRVGLLGIVQHHLAVAVHHFGIGSGLTEHAPVGEGRIGVGHFPHGDAVGQLPHAQRRQADVGKLLAVDLFGLHQIVEAHLLRGKSVALFRGQICQNLDGNGVQRLAQAVVDQHPAAVASAFVLGPLPAVEHHIGRILIGGAGGDHAVFQRRAVDRNGLDGRAGRQAALGGAVEGQAALLFTHAAAHCHDVAAFVVHDHNGRLHLLAGIGLGYVFYILVDRIHHILHVQIDGGIDVEATGGDHLAGIVVGVAVLVHEILNDVAHHLVFKIGIIVFFFRLVLELLAAVGAGQVIAVGGIAVHVAQIAAVGAAHILLFLFLPCAKDQLFIQKLLVLLL